jgi:hypothetical protein
MISNSGNVFEVQVFGWTTNKYQKFVGFKMGWIRKVKRDWIRVGREWARPMLINGVDV